MGTRTTHRRDFSEDSEFGGDWRPNTLPAKDAGAPLSAGEKLRLIYQTGTEIVTADPDRRAWLGLAPEGKSQVDLED